MSVRVPDVPAKSLNRCLPCQSPQKSVLGVAAEPSAATELMNKLIHDPNPKPEEVDCALKYYWSIPVLAPLRAELRRFAETVYPSAEEETALCQAEEDGELARDTTSYWECWNYFRALLSNPEVNTNYWASSCSSRIDDWERYLQEERERTLRRRSGSATELTMSKRNTVRN